MSIIGCQLLGKRLTERRLFFQQLQVHFACVFSGISAFVHFFGASQILRQTILFFQCCTCKCVSLSLHKRCRKWAIFYRLRNIKSVLEVTWRSTERNIKNVIEVTWRSAERKHQERVRSYLDAVHMTFLPHPTRQPSTWKIIQPGVSLNARSV